MSASAKVNLTDLKRQLLEAEANAILDRLCNPVVNLEPEERLRDSLSAPEIPTCNRQLTPIEINQILNTQIPKRWRKQISGVVWREDADL